MQVFITTVSGKTYVVFENCYEREKWEWLWYDHQPVCAGAYDNAFELEEYDAD